MEYTLESYWIPEAPSFSGVYASSEKHCTCDPWKALKFNTKEECADWCENRTPEYIPVEHGFYNPKIEGKTMNEKLELLAKIARLESIIGLQKQVIKNYEHEDLKRFMEEAGKIAEQFRPRPVPMPYYPVYPDPVPLMPGYPNIPNHPQDTGNFSPRNPYIWTTTISNKTTPNDLFIITQ